MKFTKRSAPILRLLSEETIQEYFGSRNHEQIWRELNTNADHRSKVIEWLDDAGGACVWGNQRDEQESERVEDSRSIQDVEGNHNEKMH
jgi:hypothetical protein